MYFIKITNMTRAIGFSSQSIKTSAIALFGIFRPCFFKDLCDKRLMLPIGINIRLR